MKSHNEGCSDVTVWRGRKPLEREMENTQDETTGRWFKIIVSVMASSALNGISWNFIKGRPH